MPTYRYEAELRLSGHFETDTELTKGEQETEALEAVNDDLAASSARVTLESVRVTRSDANRGSKGNE